MKFPAFPITKYVLFCVLYMAIAVSVTLLTQYFPVILRIENSIYDSFQQYKAIDSYYAPGRKRFASELDRVMLVDIASYLDRESGRLDRTGLTSILQALAKHDHGLQAVFVDYGYFAPPPEDSLLTAVMQHFGDRLVLPFGLITEAVPEKTFGQPPIFESSNRDSLLYSPPRSGFVDVFSLGENEPLRYILLSAGGSVNHCVKQLVSLTHPERLQHPVFQSKDQWMEVNYILRNDAGLSKGRIPAIEALPAKEVLKMESESRLGQALAGKDLVFVGLFSEVRTVYDDLAVDRFRTPISDKLQGAYILLNAYLNLTADPPAYLRKSGILLIAIINLVLSIISVEYARRTFKIPIKSPWLILAEIVLTVAVFFLLLWLFYDNWYIKISFVPTSLLWVANQRLLRQYTSVRIFERVVKISEKA